MAQREPVPEKSAAMRVATDIVIGGGVGAVSKTAMAPVERVKILLQTMKNNPQVQSGEVEPYKNAWDCVKRVRAEQGVKAFWRGNLVNVLRYAPQQGSALAFNDAIFAAMPKVDAKEQPIQALVSKLVAGGSAGAIANTVAFPFDYARTRLASDLKAGRPQYKGIFDCIGSTVRAQGITGLYTGWATTVTGAFVYRAGQLGLFRQIQDSNPWKDDTGTLGAASTFCAVTLGRTAVMPLNYPLDTIRRQLMLQSEIPLAERAYKGGIDCARKILRKEGVRGFYGGFVPELFRGVGGSLVVVGYDRLKVIFDL